VSHDAERGFTLIETVVAVSIIALLAGIVVWSFAQRPAAAWQAANDFDAAFATAHAIAQTQSNGATLAFLPRTDGKDGFTMRVYAGRPDGQSEVAADNVMPVDSTAGVSEVNLGKPPFSLFIGASDHVSGRAHYPSVDGARVTFATIEREPECPASGFTLRFFSPGRAALTRHLACTIWVATPPLPNPSPTPNIPIVVPTGLTYFWPADREQTFDATEWGYTHWFATTDGFRCGNGVATFPNVLPSPYSPPYDEQEGIATPSPPPDTPFSYPNSFGQGSNDAPAAFPLEPSAAGTCSATVSDDFGQRASAGVDVMGWLTATYAGKSYTHSTQPTLQFPRGALAQRGASVRVNAGKTYDARPLQPQTYLDPLCASYLRIETQPGSTPQMPSKQPATATIVLHLAAAPASPLQCSGIFFDQYPGSRAGEGVPFGAVLGEARAVDLWPPAIEFAARGSSLVQGAHCLARPYSGTQFHDLATPPQWLAGLVSLDGNGCYDGSAWIREPESSGAFDVLAAQSSCLTSGSLQRGGWSPDNRRPGPDGLALAAAQGAHHDGSVCGVTLRGDPNAPNGGVVALAARVVTTCPQKGNAWLGPLDGICYDLYDDVTGTTQNGGWIEESNVGLYVPHGTSGDQLYEWIVGDGSCYIQTLLGTPFANWTTILGNGDPTPPPAPSPSPIANPAGFGVDDIVHAGALTNAPDPKPTQPPSQDCK
jgi:prepilin-type N-terminal cleavage/methylation domain-containing protein